MTTATGYSIWLMPEGEIYSRLENLISKLSKKYKTPKFKPHLTLIGEIQDSKEDIMHKTSNLARAISPYDIILSGVSYLDEYFRSLFIKAKQTDELLKSNLVARSMFNRENDQKYIPHLSLMYGNLTSKTKETIIFEIGREFNFTFRVKSIHLYSTNGQVNDWFKIKEFPVREGESIYV